MSNRPLDPSQFVQTRAAENLDDDLRAYLEDEPRAAPPPRASAPPRAPAPQRAPSGPPPAKKPAPRTPSQAAELPSWLITGQAPFEPTAQAPVLDLAHLEELAPEPEPVPA